MVTLTDARMDRIGTKLGARFRPDTCVVSRPPATKSVGGARTSGPYAEVATVGCRVQAANRQATERVFGGQVVPAADYLIAVPRGTDVQNNDRIAVNGSTVEVVFAPAAESFSFELMVAGKVTE